jgi:hypothetical protein
MYYVCIQLITEMGQAPITRNTTKVDPKRLSMILQMKTPPFYIIKWPITNLTDFPLICAQLSPNARSLVRLVLHRKTSETNGAFFKNNL